MKSKHFNLLVKAAYFLLFSYAASVVSELPQFDSKGVYARLIIYTSATLVLPVLWKLSEVTKKFFNRRYPHFLDLCVTFVMASDLFGNIADLYDSVWWWDDAMHFLMMFPWVFAFAYVIHRLKCDYRIRAALVFSYGLFSGVVWEIYEYFASTRNGRIEGVTGYPDTIGDLIMTVAGSLAAAVLFALWLRKSIAKK